MKAEGPVLDTLTRRLAETPKVFLGEPIIRNRGEVDLAAVVTDLLLVVGGRLQSEADAKDFRPSTKAQRNEARLDLIVCWLLYDGWFHGRAELSAGIRRLLKTGLTALAALIDAERFVTDPDRREELVRLVLSLLQLRPAGESLNQAGDRLKSLDSVERDRVIREARTRKEEQERARKLREAMAQERAREAAAKANREW